MPPGSKSNFDRFRHEPASRRRHAAEAQAGLAIRHCAAVLFDGDDRVTAERERQGEESRAGIQIEDGCARWDCREDVLHEDFGGAHVGLEERGRRHEKRRATQIFAKTFGSGDVPRLPAENEGIAARVNVDVK